MLEWGLWGLLCWFCFSWNSVRFIGNVCYWKLVLAEKAAHRCSGNWLVENRNFFKPKAFLWRKSPTYKHEICWEFLRSHGWKDLEGIWMPLLKPHEQDRIQVANLTNQMSNIHELSLRRIMSVNTEKPQISKVS